MEAGTPPDVWIDASGYFPGYMNEDYAIALEKYVDVSSFIPSLVEPYTINGHVYALPFSNVGGGFAINVDMLTKIGYTMPDQKGWTTDEFLRLGANLKAAKYPATMIMAKGGLNSWTQFWLFAFGGTFYKDGIVARTAINSPESLAGLAYIKKIIDAGYTPPPLEVNDDDAVEWFTTNKVFSSVMQNGHVDGTMPEQLRLGKIKAPINVRFVEVPHAPGRAHTPAYGYQTVALAHKSDNEGRNKLVADLLVALIGKEAQLYNTMIAGGFSTLKGWQPKLGTSASQTYQDVAGLMSTAGLVPSPNLGTKTAELRRIWNTLSEQWVRGKLTPQAFLKDYETQANKILAQ